MSIRISLEAYERAVARRKAELGFVGKSYVARNSGVRRSPSKQALLKAMADAAAAAGKNRNA